jgi:hypothetical protein
MNGSQFDETILVDMCERDDLCLEPVGHMLWTPLLAANVKYLSNMGTIFGYVGLELLSARIELAAGLGGARLRDRPDTNVAAIYGECL